MRWIAVACFVTLCIPAFSQGAKPLGSYDALIAKARTLIAEKRAQEAVKVSEQAIALNQERWEGYVMAASGYSAQQLYDDTIGMLQMALGRAPDEKKAAIRAAITEARRHLSAQSAGEIGYAPPVPSAQPSTQPGAPTQAEIVLWKSIENSNRAEDYRGYLASYPNGVYAGLATSRIEALAWKEIEATQNLDDLRAYLQTYPNGPHAIAAANLLQNLRWTAISNSSNPADFRAYLREFPNSTYAPMASNRLEELEWLPVSQSADSADLKAYIESHPDGQYLPAAQRRYKELIDQQEAKKKQEQEDAAAEEQRMQMGWDFKWVHRHLRPTWAYGIPTAIYDNGTMTVSPQGIKWVEDVVKPGASHDFAATCADIRFTKGFTDNENSIEIYNKGVKITFVGNDGAEQFLKGFSHFCQQH